MSRLGAMHLIKHTGPKHSGTVIFFHGSGGTGGDMKEWVNIVSKNTFSFPHLTILFPTAPLQAYTPAGGQMSNVWFDRTDISPNVPEVLESIDSMQNEVDMLIKNENDAGVPTNRIVLGGFSMGGALTFHAAYRWQPGVAGAFAVSSFLNDESVVYDWLKNANSKQIPPLLQVHGNADTLVLPTWGEVTNRRLSERGVNTKMRVIARLGHSVDRASMRAVKEWVEQVLPPL